MVYTQEQLMKAVREAGRDGQPFSVGEVRAQLGLKSRDKRELKRFRSRLRECCQSLGGNIEKLGPNTYRMKQASLPAAAKTSPARTAAAAQPAQQNDVAARAALKERVGITARKAEPVPGSARSPQPRAAQRVTAQVPVPVASDAGPSLGSRVTSWLSRVRGRRNTAATALSRLALDLQPNASHFQYQWVDGDLRVKLSGGLGGRPRPRAADE